MMGSSLAVPQKAGHGRYQGPSNSTLDKHSREMKTSPHTHEFHSSTNHNSYRKVENSLLRNKQINKSESCHTAEQYLPIKRNEVILATTCMNPEA